MPGAEEAYTKIENVYNNKNKLTQVKNYNGSALANQVEYSYDAAGNLTVMKTAQGTQLTKYEYDSYGNLTVLTDPLGQKETYTYDINGNMTSKTDKNGAITRYTYDGLARKLSQSATKDGVTQSETMGYTQTGALAFSQNDNLRTDYVYDDQGRKVKETDSNGVEKAYTYDTAGNVKNSVVKVNGTPKKELAYTYDKKDRLIQVYEAGTLVATYSYDANGNRNSLSYGNGDSAAYNYNLANLVTSLNNKKGSDVLSSYGYTYYLDGNQATKGDHKGRQTSYSYDGLGRLTKEAESGASDAITKAYTFDSANNRSAMTVSGAEAYTVGYTYDLNNRLTEETKQTGGKNNITEYQYDANGNTISKKIETVNEDAERQLSSSEAYTYDGFDRMTAVKNDVGDIVYSYKPDGLRISKTVNGVKTTQVWEGQDITLELDGSNAVANRYIPGNGLIKSDQNGWYLFNAHGDVVQLADGAGTVTKEYVYDAFGNERNIDLNDSNPFRYCGEYFDKETGDIYLRARYYDPEIGRFISEDSFTGDVNDPLSLNLYTYCRNNPILYIDPSGNKYIIDDVWHGMVYRADAMRDNPSAYNVGNWLSMGFFDTVNGAVNPEKPLSMQHWIDSAAVVTTFAGGYGAYKSAVPKTPVTTTAGKTIKGAGSIAKVGDEIGNLGKLVKNPGIKVNWESAREHALNRMSKNGVTQDMFESWVKGGKVIQQDSNTYLFLTKNGVAVISKNGIPQTAYTSAQFKDHIKNAIKQVYGK